MFVCAQHFVWRSIIKFAAPTLRLWHVHFIASGQFVAQPVRRIFLGQQAEAMAPEGEER